MRTAVFIGTPLVATVLCTLESLRAPVGINVTSESVTVGAIVRQVTVNGVLQPMTTVEIETPVSGTVSEVDADVNSVVHAGQVLVRLDGSEKQAALDQARTTLNEARADLITARNTADTAASTLNRAEKLAEKDLIAELDLDSARTAMAQADADVQAANARVEDARTDVRTANGNLQQTVIRSPVDGVVLSRNISTGDNVTLIQNAPVLFRIATDFHAMQVLADIDESDVASIPIGETASLHVDAFPDRTFVGHVAEIRLNEVHDQADEDDAALPASPDSSRSRAPAVMHPLVITVENPDETLRPGMTANVTFEGARRDHATRIPNSALSFVPSSKVLEAAKQKPPELPLLTSDDAGNSARVWAYDGTEFTPITIHIGLADEHWTELLSGPLDVGATLVTDASMDGSSDPAPN